jgi:tetratricopeptide (TPR) repeat protein
LAAVVRPDLTGNPRTLRSGIALAIPGKKPFPFAANPIMSLASPSVSTAQRWDDGFAFVVRVVNTALDLHQMGRRDEAALGYRRGLSVLPTERNALHLLGVAAWERGEVERARVLIRRAVTVDPTFIEARLNLGRLYRDRGHQREAAAQFRALAALEPGSPSAWFRLGNAQTAAASGGGGTLPEAIAALERSLALQPDQPDVLGDLALALRLSGRLDDAIGVHRRAVERAPDRPDVRMSFGNTLLEAGERDLSLTQLRRAVALLPAEGATQFNLGNILQSLGDAGGAERAYLRSWRMGNPTGLVRAGMVRHQIGRIAEAEAAFRAALGLPGVMLSTPIEELTRLMVDQGRIEEARGFFTHLFNNPPAAGDCRAECLTALADIALSEGRPSEAAALATRVRGDNCRLFTVRSLATMQGTLAARGLRLRRPQAPASGPRITSSTLATHGRFAHNVLEYILIRLYAEKHGLTLETPDWVGGYYFDLHDPRQGTPLRPLYFPRRIVNDLVTGARPRVPLVDYDILSPLFLFEHKEAYRERVQSWLRPRPVWAPFIEPTVQRLRSRGNTIVAIHIRRGDFVQYNYPITQTQWYVDWLRALWPTLDRPVLYVASDDLESVRVDFADFAPTILADVAPPWPGLEFLQDFHVLMNADVLGVSAASGFSLLAARLNTTARLFVEPDVAARRVRAFAPWIP